MKLVQKECDVRDFAIIKKLSKELDLTVIKEKIKYYIGENIDLVVEVSPTPNNKGTLHIFAKNDVSKHCGFLSNFFDKVEIRDFGANIVKEIEYDEDALQELVDKNDWNAVETFPTKLLGYKLYLNMDARYYCYGGSNGIHLFSATYDFNRKVWIMH